MGREVDNAIVKTREREDGHMSDDMTPAPEGGEPTAQQENWEARYVGLQRSTAKQAERLASTTADLDRLSAEHESAVAELETFRNRDADANEDEAARQQYEALRARFEAPPPTPLATNPARGGDWTSASSKYAERERKGTSTGWPS